MNADSKQSGDRGIIAAVTDMLFETRIRSTAAALELPYGNARNLADLEQRLERQQPALLIVDMEISGAPAVEFIRQGKSSAAGPTVLAYLPHVRQDLADAARSAGADVVLPRSKFSADLANLLRQFAG
jgi:DNA-binding NarL/FixJ family response regulator